SDGGDATRSEHSELLRGALQAARQAVLAMRASGEIGDDAFHRMEEELDWLEMAGGSTGEWNNGTQICCGISLSRPNGSVDGNRVTPLGGGPEQYSYLKLSTPLADEG